MTEEEGLKQIEIKYGKPIAFLVALVIGRFVLELLKDDVLKAQSPGLRGGEEMISYYPH